MDEFMTCLISEYCKSMRISLQFLHFKIVRFENTRETCLPIQMCFSVLVSNHAQQLILIARTCDSRKRSFKLFDQLAMHAKPRYKLVRVIKERNANKPWRFLEKVFTIT